MNKKHLLLKNLDFLLLWMGQLVSNMGTKVYQIAYAWWVTVQTGSPMVLSVVILLNMLPGFFLGIYAGKWADKINPKWIIVVADFFQGAVMLWIAYESYQNTLNIYHFYISAFLASVANTFFRPAVFSAIPFIVRKKDILTANSYMSFGMNVSSILGPALAGSFISIFGFRFVFLINALSFMISAISEIFIKTNRDQLNNRVAENKTKKSKKFADSFMLIWKMSIARNGILIFITINFFASVINLLPFIVEKVGLDSKSYGHLLMVNGIGATLVSVLLGFRLIQEKINLGKMRVISVYVLAISMLVLGVATHFYFLVFAMLFVGISIGAQSILLNAGIQVNIENNQLGLFAGIRYMLTDLIMPAGLFLSGLIANVFSVNIVLIVFGVLILINLIWVKKFNMECRVQL